MQELYVFSRRREKPPFERYKRVGICTSVKAELLAVKHGLELAWSDGYRRILFEVDSHALDTW